MTVCMTIAMCTGCAHDLATGTISRCLNMTMCTWVCHVHILYTKLLPGATLNYQELPETFRTYQDIPAPTITYHGVAGSEQEPPSPLGWYF